MTPLAAEYLTGVGVIILFVIVILALGWIFSNDQVKRATRVFWDWYEDRNGFTQFGLGLAMIAFVAWTGLAIAAYFR